MAGASFSRISVLREFHISTARNTSIAKLNLATDGNCLGSPDDEAIYQVLLYGQPVAMTNPASREFPGLLFRDQASKLGGKHGAGV